METKNSLRENLIHQKAYQAKSKAVIGGVYVCSNKDEFNFIPLEEVIYEGMSLKAYLIEQSQQQIVLKKELEEIKKRLIAHEEAIKVLADKLEENSFM